MTLTAQPAAPRPQAEPAREIAQPPARLQQTEPLETGLIALVLVLVIVVAALAVWVYKLRARVRAGTAKDRDFGTSEDRGSGPPEDRDFGRSSVVPPDRAGEGALRGFQAYGLMDRADWGPLLRNRALGEPILVQRLDVSEPADAFYYLVPVGGEVGAAARVDGITGEYLEACAFVPRGSERAWGAMIADWRTEAATRRRLAGRTFERADKGETVVADGRGVGVHPAFVWKPCVESRSPFYPFRLVTIGDQVRYVRIDGKEFASLTDLGPGSLVREY